MSEAVTPRPHAALPAIAGLSDIEADLASRRQQNFMIAEMLRNHPSRRRSPVWHHLRIGFAGFATGCLIVVPTVMIAKGHLRLLPDLPVWRAPSSYPAAATASADAVPAVGAPALLRPPEPARRPTVVIEPPLKEAEELAEAIATAQALFDRGDVGRVRQILADEVVIQSPEAAFLLAETYDPNVIAGRNLARVEADVARARRHYTSALIGGVEAARQRLRGLE